MLSRLALRKGAFASLMRTQTQQRLLLAVSARPTSTQVENWEKANQIYYGPERDTTNFPIPRQMETPPPTRMGVLPKSWFDFFYEKTGVTGPYMFGAGLTTFLLSKEIWVVEHGFVEFVAFWASMLILVKRFGAPISKHLTGIDTQFREKYWIQPIAESKKSAQNIIEQTEKAIWSQEGQKMMFDVKKENVDLQLEAVYRQRQAEVHDAVKKRLDYQLDMQNAQRAFEQEHMVNWIVQSVVKGITPQQEKDSITKCIKDLKGLAAAQA